MARQMPVQPIASQRRRRDGRYTHGRTGQWRRIGVPFPGQPVSGRVGVRMVVVVESVGSSRLETIEPSVIAETVKKEGVGQIDLAIVSATQRDRDLIEPEALDL